jgi:hypothetical protein
MPSYASRRLLWYFVAGQLCYEARNKRDRVVPHTQQSKAYAHRILVA